MVAGWVLSLFLSSPSAVFAPAHLLVLNIWMRCCWGQTRVGDVQPALMEKWANLQGTSHRWGSPLNGVGGEL